MGHLLGISPNNIHQHHGMGCVPVSLEEYVKVLVGKRMEMPMFLRDFLRISFRDTSMIIHMFLLFLSQDQAKSSAGVLSDVPTDLNQLARGVARCNPYIW